MELLDDQRLPYQASSTSEDQVITSAWEVLLGRSRDSQRKLLSASAAFSTVQTDGNFFSRRTDFQSYFWVQFLRITIVKYGKEIYFGEV